MIVTHVFLPLCILICCTSVVVCTGSSYLEGLLVLMELYFYV